MRHLVLALNLVLLLTAAHCWAARRAHVDGANKVVNISRVVSLQGGEIDGADARIDWTWNGDDPATFTPPVGPTLVQLQNAKIRELRAEAKRRIEATLDDLSVLDYNTNRTAVINAARNARTDIQALSTKLTIDDYDLVNTPAWP